MRTYILHHHQVSQTFSPNRKLEGRKAVDVLAGLCLGILADGSINSREADFLKDWITHNASFLPEFVLFKLVPKLHVLRSGEDAPPEFLDEIAKILGELVGLDEVPEDAASSQLVASAGRPSKLIFDDLAEPISFRGLEVVITGNFKNLSRAEVASRLNQLGALPRQAAPTHATSIVIVGQDGSASWASRNFGRKLERALELRQAGFDIKIITEQSFLTHVSNVDQNEISHLDPEIAPEADLSALPLSGKTFVITGTLSMDRDGMKAFIESKGGKVSGSVSAKTHYVLAGEGGGSKRDKAEKLGVPVIDEAALQGML